MLLPVARQVLPHAPFLRIHGSGAICQLEPGQKALPYTHATDL